MAFLAIVCNLSNMFMITMLVCSCTCMVLDTQIIYKHLVKGYRIGKSMPKIMWHLSGKEHRERKQ